MWAEYNDPLIPQVVLTLDEPWSPSLDDFAKQEVTISKVSQVIKDLMLTSSIHQLSAVVSYQDVQAALETFDNDFGQMVEDSACLHTSYIDPSADTSDCRYVSTVVSDKWSSVITPEVLAR